ncbi:MAG: hypothetical protein AAF266_14510 [Planctomycetota bacterium]
MDTEKLGGSLVNVVLGALILWVAQTTFQHSGELAGVDEKFGSLQAQNDNLRDRLDGLMHDVGERTRSRFTAEDGDKMGERIEQTVQLVTAVERRIAERVTELQLKVIALQTQGVDQREVGRLRTDLERLQAGLYPAGANGPVSIAARREANSGFTTPVTR